jgi:hypothetical protein
MTEQRKIIASDAGVSIRSIADISNAVRSAYGSGGLILTENDLCPEFFDLRTGLAGALFQKFENYQLCLAVVVPNPDRYGDRFNELAREHKSHNRIRIVPCREEAIAWLQVGR